jgi:hypothetical protein
VTLGFFIATCALVAPAQASAPLLFADGPQLPVIHEGGSRHRTLRNSSLGDREERRHVRHERSVRTTAVHAKKRRGGSRNARLASLGGEISTPSLASRSLTGGGVQWVASSSCLNSRLRGVIANVASGYGSVRVNSTCRSVGHNRAVGGASHSYHLTGNAADIVVHGNLRGAMAYLRSSVGGYKYYGGGRFHIDTGPRRTF